MPSTIEDRWRCGLPCRPCPLGSDPGRSDGVGLRRLGLLALAYLVVNRDRPVPRSESADVLWGDELPRSFDQLVRGLASKIRVVLQDVKGAVAPSPRCK